MITSFLIGLKNLADNAEYLGNNMYVFPGIGLGTILSKATTVTQSMIYASATSLSTSLLSSEVSDGLLYPDLTRIRDVSVIVAIGVIRAAQKAGVDRQTTLRDMDEDELETWVRSKMYDPLTETRRVEEEVSELMKIGKTTNGINGLHL